MAKKRVAEGERGKAETVQKPCTRSQQDTILRKAWVLSQTDLSFQLGYSLVAE